MHEVSQDLGVATVHDIDAATKLIACVLTHPCERAEVDWIEPSMFANPHQALVWEAVMSCDSDCSGPEFMVLVMESLAQKPAALHALNTSMAKVEVPGAGIANFYAERVARDARRRFLLNAAIRAIQLVEESTELDVEMVLRDHWDTVLTTAKPSGESVPGLYTVSDFLDSGASEVYDWVIPGLLEHQERLILVAPVKSGKSVLTRQIGLCVASGLHPFDPFMQIPRKRVLLLDLENPAGILRRDLRRQMHGLEPGGVEGMWVLHQPAGIDLGLPADRRMLEQAIINTRPDLVMLGPLYKAYGGLDESYEKQAAGVQGPVDYLRSKYGCAFWIEHHASKADPTGLFGSSRWARWFDAKVALVPEDPSLPPPYNILEWQATYRDSRRVCPEYLEMRSVEKFGQVSWVARFTDSEPFGLQMERACEE